MLQNSHKATRRLRQRRLLRLARMRVIADRVAHKLLISLELLRPLVHDLVITLRVALVAWAGRTVRTTVHQHLPLIRWISLLELDHARLFRREVL